MKVILALVVVTVALLGCGSTPQAPAAVSTEVPPRAENLVQPAYPEEARKAGVEGKTIVEVTIGADGAVLGCSLVTSSGNGHLDAAALGAAQSAKFAPGTKDGKPVEMKVQIPFQFKLGDSQKESRGKAPGSTYRAGWSDEPQCREARVPALPAMEV
jgi:TonB family protein